MKLLCTAAVLVIFTAKYACGYSSGAPCAAQNSLTPSPIFHGKPQDILANPPPFQFSVTDAKGLVVSSYKANGTYRVRLRGTDFFRGFLLQPRVASGPGVIDGEDKVGQFIKERRWNTVGVRYQDCEGLSRDSITHLNRRKKFYFTVMWEPREAILPVQFTLSLVVNQTYFWTKWTPKMGYLTPESAPMSIEQSKLYRMKEISEDKEIVELKAEATVNPKPCADDELLDSETKQCVKPGAKVDKIAPAELVLSNTDQKSAVVQLLVGVDTNTTAEAADGNQEFIIKEQSIEKPEKSASEEAVPTLGVKITPEPTKPTTEEAITVKITAKPTEATTEEPTSVTLTLEPEATTEEPTTVEKTPEPTEATTEESTTAEITPEETESTTEEPTTETTQEITIKTQIPEEVTPPDELVFDPKFISRDTTPRRLVTSTTTEPSTTLPLFLVYTGPPQIIEARETTSTIRTTTTTTANQTTTPEPKKTDLPFAAVLAADVKVCDPSPCENGATCHDIDGKEECQCAKEWTGRLCTERNYCINSPCENNAACLNKDHGFECICEEGWAGSLCTRPCPANFCNNGGTCIIDESTNLQKCKCILGWAGLRCEQEINECEPNPCQNGANCVDRFNRFECLCKPGFTGETCKWPCRDVYKSCETWEEEQRCQYLRPLTAFYDDNCAVTCKQCSYVAALVPPGIPFPPLLEPFKFLIGKWRTEQKTGEHFPIPFDQSTGYIEEISFQITEVPMFGSPSVNFTANAVSTSFAHNVQIMEGFLSIKPRTNPPQISLATISNSGLILIEEGTFVEQGIELETNRTIALRSAVRLSFPPHTRRTFKISGEFLVMEVFDIEDVESEYAYSAYFSRA